MNGEAGARPALSRNCIRVHAAREPGRPARSRCPNPRVKGKASPMGSRLRVPFPSLVLALVAAACASAPGSRLSPSGGAPAPTLAASASAGAAARTVYPVTLTDDSGRSVTIDHAHRRIVSRAPSNTEIACALGACDDLVGVPQYKVGYPRAVLRAIKGLPIVVSYGPVD